MQVTATLKVDGAVIPRIRKEMTLTGVDIAVVPDQQIRDLPLDHTTRTGLKNFVRR